VKFVRILGFVLVALAIVAAVVPTSYNCSSDGKMLTLESGKQVPMKCYWTAQASIAAAIPLFAVGLLLGFARRRETARALAIVAAALGGVIVLLPTYLIGTCVTFDMICNLVEKPAMLAVGILTVVAAAAAFFLAGKPETAEAA
jgi:hypothetical protein